MLNDHDSFFDEELFGVVVDKLPIDVDVGLVGCDSFDFLLHLHFLSLGDLVDFLEGFDPDSGSVDFDFVVVHGGVGSQNFAVLEGTFAANRDGFLQDEAIAQERLFDGASQLLYNLDVVQIGRPSQSEDGINSQLGKVLLVLGEQLGAEGGFGDVNKIFLEFCEVSRIVPGDREQLSPGGISGHPPAVDDDLGVQLHLDEFLSFSQKLPCEDGYGGGPVSDLLVLGLGNVDQNFSGRVVHMHGPKDGRPIVGDVDVLVFGAGSDGDENFVHPSGPEGGLDKISNGDGSYEGGLGRVGGTSLATYPFSSLAPSLMTWGSTF